MQAKTKRYYQIYETVKHTSVIETPGIEMLEL